MTESPKHLMREVERGESDRTPVIALTGVTLVIGSVVSLLAIVLLLLYYLV